MEKFIVKGGNRLSGHIEPAGNKNEALPVLAAVLLTEKPVTIHNLPHIGDISKMKEILESLGVAIRHLGGGSYQFDAHNLNSPEPDPELSKAIRGSFLLAAPLAIRFGHTKIYEPGGDSIGKRRLDTHVHALEQLGLKFSRRQGYYSVKNNGLNGVDLLLDEASVMATEHLIMAAVLAKGTTRIYNAACEPHVQGLCEFLVRMGAKISGIGSNHILIEGVEALGECEYRIQPDHTEVGSLIGLAAVTHSEITIEKAGWRQLGQILSYFRRLGVEVIKKGEDDLLIPAKQKLIIQNDIDDSIPKIDDAPWPGFPADLTSIMTIVATQCKGTVLIHEKLFESRLFWVDKLISMGAKIVLCDPHRAVIVGPAKLRGMTLSSPDIRAGMALLIAALCAEGTSEIYNIGQIDRGYQDIDQRLRALGAEIQRV
ncbi:MAG: UDP-N-acetylglucosamine 1-carboxyvinyltransferase [Candidatus Lambdaproteobacteria bacterium RIFOXYD2_FULL_50_16]|uniref:UDP-N-acetylglucosamine 1-carboxyvinyltransferase n=1 Tax=Candidatus Lambdaproteobacteria bacterium RIFOXYD2_FULL_50_16 TaxID=1817772 RepID=A0A1F6G6G3_9PROT|nr:MAG: UDP-N-acetylglucosamine 1-carboxyvinyltransferase [Candidatus Lambdaproteobacteria bacterium RIFOXYD2_FULL_50_16]